MNTERSFISDWRNRLFGSKNNPDNGVPTSYNLDDTRRKSDSVDPTGTAEAFAKAERAEALESKGFSVGDKVMYTTNKGNVIEATVMGPSLDKNTGAILKVNETGNEFAIDESGLERLQKIDEAQMREAA